MANGVPYALADEQPVHVRTHTPAASPQYCGIDSLYVGLLASGKSSVQLRQLEGDMPLGADGVDVEKVLEETRKNGVMATAVQADLEQLSRWKSPAILHVQNKHFITFLGIEGDRVVLFDNAVGVLDCSTDFFSYRYGNTYTAVLLGVPPPEVFLRVRATEIIICVTVAALLVAALVLRRRKGTPLSASA